jgi:serine-type D-Ala-D-Ala carboxypeptidase/endopeptidase (penicillin-binding protein 4)
MTRLLSFTTLFSSFVFLACSSSRQIGRSAQNNILTDSALLTAHVGISVYDTETGKYLYNYQGDKYFVPASNVKIPTCYAAMKYLGDSLVGLRYGIPEGGLKDKVVVIDVTGDPSFLHSDFKNQLVFDSFQTWFGTQHKTLGLLIKSNKIERWGSGWSWNDYDAAYMAERSSFPIYGNVVNARLLDTSVRLFRQIDYPWLFRTRLFTTGITLFDSLMNNTRPPLQQGWAKTPTPKISIERNIATNSFMVKSGRSEFKGQLIPFVTNDWSTAVQIIIDSLKTKFGFVESAKGDSTKYFWFTDDSDVGNMTIKKWHTLHSQPTDSLLKPMMHRSDNFFAEQSLLMVSNEMLGYMSDEKIIDSIIKTDFADLPQKPRWADGSGLSRYNLFTPQDLVAILNKMRQQFGMARIKEIFPTGNEGTLTNYYKSSSGYLFAKTGTLSGVVAISGYLQTRQNKQLIFSVLVNNHQASATAVRRAVEKFVEGLRNEY